MGLFAKKLQLSSRQQDADLLGRIGRGDEDALEIFYNKYFQKIYRYVYYRVGRDHHHTEEVVNDTFMEAIDKSGRFDPARGSIESWLITLSRNRIRSSNATVGRAKEYEQSWSMLDGELESIFATLDQGSIPDKALEQKELRELVGSTMGSLPENYSSILEMKYLHQMPVREIAKVTHKTEKSVESQLTRARLAFREAIQSILVDLPPAIG